MKRFGCAATALAILSVSAAAQITAGWDDAVWLVEDMRGRGVIDNVQMTLRIAPDGTASGSTGCNQFHGKAIVKGEKIRFGGIAVTLRACMPAVADQERQFLLVLREAQRARFDHAGRLQLLSAKGKALLTLTRM